MTTVMTEGGPTNADRLMRNHTEAIRSKKGRVKKAMGVRTTLGQEIQLLSGTGAVRMYRYLLSYGDLERTMS